MLSRFWLGSCWAARWAVRRAISSPASSGAALARRSRGARWSSTCRAPLPSACWRPRHPLHGLLPTPAAWQFAVTGFLGSYTTVSSFSLQTLALVRDGQILRAGGNVLLSVGLCLCRGRARYAAGSRLAALGGQPTPLKHEQPDPGSARLYLAVSAGAVIGSVAQGAGLDGSTRLVRPRLSLGHLVRQHCRLVRDRLLCDADGSGRARLCRARASASS